MAMPSLRMNKRRHASSHDRLGQGSSGLMGLAMRPNYSSKPFSQTNNTRIAPFYDLAEISQACERSKPQLIQKPLKGALFDNSDGVSLCKTTADHQRSLARCNHGNLISSKVRICCSE